MPYLDKDGLTTLWAKVKNTFALKSHSHTASDLPTATTSARGCVQVGDGLSITSAGVLSATGGGSGAVSGVKGNAESSYRTGNVNLTAANIGAAASSHTHAAGDITSGTLPVARGGTGQTTLQATRNAMGLGNTTGALPIANGGTGSTTAANARSNLGITPANIGAPVAPTNLYTNTSGTSGSFTLSSSIANFSVIEVFFKTNDGCMGCQKIWNNYSSSATFDLFDNHPYKATNTYLKCAHWSISGTSVSVSNPAEVCLNNGDAVLAYSLAAGIKITRVVGWKY